MAAATMTLAGGEASASTIAGVRAVSLLSMRAGEWGVVHSVEASPSDAATLRAMGLAPGARMRVCRAGSPTIVALMCPPDAPCKCAGTRLGLARELAAEIVVEPIDAALAADQA
jgi:Fe2+ transport system protein FeoA